MASVRRVGTVGGLLTAMMVAAAWSGPGMASAASPSEAKLSAPAGIASTTGCPDVLFVGVRGSGQVESDSGGYGREVAMVRDRVKERAEAAGMAFASERVDYTAADVSVTIPKHWRKLSVTAFEATTGFIQYMASVQDGVAKVQQRLLAAESDCGDTEQKIVLTGYSQGAMAIHRALRRFDDEGRTDILKRVVAVGLLANPERPTNSPAVRVGTSPVTDQGVANFFAWDQRDVPAACSPTRPACATTATSSATSRLLRSGPAEGASTPPTASRSFARSATN